MGLLPQGASSILVRISGPYLKNNSFSKVGIKSISILSMKIQIYSSLLPHLVKDPKNRGQQLRKNNNQNLKLQNFASLVPKEEYQLGLEIQDTKEEIQASQESIKSWTESVFLFHPFTLQQFLKTRSYEKLVPRVMVFVHIHYVNKNVLEIQICRQLHWNYSYA